jgi:hypothetical protein
MAKTDTVEDTRELLTLRIRAVTGSTMLLTEWDTPDDATGSEIVRALVATVAAATSRLQELGLKATVSLDPVALAEALFGDKHAHIC